MTARERFRAVMDFRPFDRLPLVEWAAWWDKTIARWHSEGLPEALADRYDLCRHFGLDLYWQDWIGAVRPACPQPAAHGAPIIATMSDYEKILPHLYPDPEAQPERWERWAEWARRQRQGEAVLWFTLDGFFWFPRVLLGIEPHLYAFYDEPELMHRINTDLAEWHLRVIEKIASICAPDFMTFAEDLSYNNGPMISKDQFDEFLKPYYARVIPALEKHGVIPFVDSDGDVSVPAFWFEEAGIGGILPLERQAGADISRLRAEHPRMKFIGHFDKLTMHRGEAAMRAEFERLLPAAARGGFLVSVDHQTPPGVSYRDYQLYLELFREYAGRAGEISRDRGLRV
ncbi:MAG: uroporphyrinogen decarboxylase family protein [Terrimicrobiaceae bacterium]